MSLPETRSRAGTTSSPTRSDSDENSFDRLDSCDTALREKYLSDHANGDFFGRGSKTTGKRPALKTVDVPLSSDSTFFQVLNKELSSLADLQEREILRLTEEVVQVGNEIQVMSETAKSGSKSDLATWREIFRLYIESQVFFSTGERNTGMRNSASAHNQLQAFLSVISTQKRGFKLKKTKVTLDHFLRVNMELLKNLKFHEINRLALTKIMKSIDPDSNLLCCC